MGLFQNLAQIFRNLMFLFTRGASAGLHRAASPLVSWGGSFSTGMQLLQELHLLLAQLDSEWSRVFAPGFV